jgi:hypothetical protein
MATSTRTKLFAAVALLCLVGVRGAPQHIEQCVELDGQYWPSSDENHSQPMPDMTSYITIGAAFTSNYAAGTTKGNESSSSHINHFARSALRRPENFDKSYLPAGWQLASMA